MKTLTVRSFKTPVSHKPLAFQVHFTATIRANPLCQAAGTEYFSLDVEDVSAAGSRLDRLAGVRPQLPFANQFTLGKLVEIGTLDADSGGASNSVHRRSLWTAVRQQGQVRKVRTVQVGAGDSAYGGVHGVIFRTHR